MWSMSPAEQRAALTDLDWCRRRLDGLYLQVLAQADRDRVGQAEGATSTAAWVADRTCATREASGKDLALAKDLDGPFTATGEALSAGRCSTEQARVIRRAVRRLDGDTVTHEERVCAEGYLLDHCDRLDPKRLARLGRGLFEVIDPERADERDGEALRRKEERARERARFATRSHGDGTVSGSFRLPEAHADRLTAVIEAIIAPRRTGEGRYDDQGRKLAYPRLMGQGFMALIEQLSLKGFPDTTRTAATTVVTLDYQTLLRGVGTATLATGTRISAAQARRWACAAGIIPVVLGGDSLPLDVGRERRLHTKAMRTALALRDQGCRAAGCDRPPAWCEAHHLTPWSQGGSTSVDQAVLLCAYHHRLIHSPGYSHARDPDGRIGFHRRE